MGRTSSLLVVLALLQACKTPPPRSEAASDPRPPPAAPAPPVAPAAAPAPSEPGIQRLYRLPLPICFDGALRVCRERDYRVRSQNPTSLSAAARGLDWTMTFARAPGDRTRVVVRVQGRTVPENRDEAISLLDKLSEALLEPKD